MAKLTHIDESGSARMVEVSPKVESLRKAVAEGLITMNREAFEALDEGRLKKGDALATARIAAISGAKKTSDLIPLCHPLRLTGVNVTFDLEPETHTVRVTAEVTAFDRTGVEMEALTAASVGALTIYDMCKAIDRGMTISSIQLLSKEGGKSGAYHRP